MKKLLAVVLSLLCVLNMGLAAFAEDLGSQNAEVKGTYEVSEKADATEYSVDITWSGLEFTYTGAYEKWDSQKHEYVTQDGVWKNSDAKITVTNHSNAAIEVTPTWNADEGFDSAVMKFFNGENEITVLEIGSATPSDGSVTGVAKVGTISVKPEGSLPSTANGGKIGSITITISAVSNIPSVASAGELKSALESGGEHKLSGDIALSETVSVSEGKTVVLDLNGHNLTSAANAINVPATSTLTVKDSAGQGTISGNNSGTGIENSGTLIIEGGVIQKFGYAINNKGEGDVTISGGHFASQIYSDDASGAKVIIKGGTFSSIDYCLDWVADGYEAVNNSGTWTVVEKNS